MRNSSTYRWVALGAIAVILGSLGAWYGNLALKGRDIAATATGRGLGDSIPTFAGEGGSTNQNLQKESGGREIPEQTEAESGQSFVSRVWNRLRGGTKEETSTLQSAAFRIGSALSSGIAFLAGGGEEGSDAEKEAYAVPRLWRVSGVPVAGMNFIEAASTTKLRFVERATGYLVDANPVTGEVERATNTLVPTIYEAVVAGSGVAALRTTDERGTIVTITGTPSSGTSTERTLSASPLPPNITSFALSHDGTKALYTISDDAGGFAGVRANADGSSSAKVFDSAIGRWRIFPAKDGRILLSTPPSSGIPGSAFLLTAKGQLLALETDVPGLTFTPDPLSESYLFGAESAGTLTLSAKTKTGGTRTVGLSTVAEKCVWNPARPGRGYCAVPENETGGTFLDRWYRGAFHPEDSWWSFDAETGNIEQLVGYAGGVETPPDVDIPVIDSSGQWIAFRDARDQSLWILRIRE